MKYIFALVLFVSCVETRTDPTVTHIIQKNNNICGYQLNGGQSIYDTCGKFNVGDKLW